MRTAFRSAGIPNADLDARLLASKLAGVEAHQLATEGDRPMPEPTQELLMRAMHDRLDGRPVHRILGERDFYGLTLSLSAATLEPRPDTETLIDAVLPLAEGIVAAKGSCSIVDLGVGTGAIGLALVASCPGARCLGVDISAEAVATALENARRLGLGDRYTAVTGDWLEGIDERFDLIVSNPPYIPTPDLVGLEREVREHDPLRALDGGADGLDAYRIIAVQSVSRLENNGYVAVEIGIDQTQPVKALFETQGFESLGVFADLGGVERVLTFKIGGNGGG